MDRLIIRNAAIVTMDDDTPDMARGDILVEGGAIRAIGADLPAEGAEVVDAAGKIAMPGFVNAHIHTWQTGLRGVAADWMLSDYLRAMHAGLATHFDPEDVGIANHVGALHQLHAGATTIADWCHNNPTPAHTDAAIDGLKAAGIRAVFLHGSPKPDPKPGQPHFSEIPMPRAEIERLMNGALSDRDALVTLGLAVLGPMLSVEAVTDADLRLAQELGLVTSMHVSGPLMQPEGFVRLSEQGLLGPHVNIVHGNTMSDRDLGLLVDAGASFSPTPEIELQMGFGVPLTNRVKALGGLIAIGSDVESGMSGDMFAVIRFTLQAARHEATMTARRETGKPPAVMGFSTREALRWATIDAARALGLADRVGSLAVGKQADIILIDAGAINMRPVHDPVASVVFHAGPQNVDSVFVAGRAMKRGGKLLNGDMPALLDRLADSGARIMADFGRGEAARRSA